MRVADMRARSIRLGDLPRPTTRLTEQQMASIISDDYTFPGHVICEVFTVLWLAHAIEPDVNKLMLWYQHAKLMELDELTPEQLVQSGRSMEVIRFLNAIRTGSRH
jgi:hypothetical protein